MSLSDKRKVAKFGEESFEFYLPQDVREAVEELKVSFLDNSFTIREDGFVEDTTPEYRAKMLRIIDEIFGEKLT